MNPSPQPSAKWLTLLQRLSSHLLPFLFLLIGIPLLTIVGFGLHAIYAQGYALPFFAFITLLTIIAGLCMLPVTGMNMIDNYGSS